MIRRAKIVCTLGPATDTPERARALVEAGMDVARLNFSHGAHADHGRRYHEVRQAAAGRRAQRRRAGRPAGPEDPARPLRRRAGRCGRPASGSGSPSRTSRATHDRVSTTYKQLADDVRPGDRLLVDDGNVALVAVEVENGTDVVCDVTEGGTVSNNKGLSLPGVEVSVPAMSEKDADDLEFALRLGVDFIALSFVRSPEDVKLVHQVMDRGRHPPSGDRQDREAGGGRPARGDRARLRRHDGRPRRPRRRDAARAGAGRAEAGGRRSAATTPSR